MLPHENINYDGGASSGGLRLPSLQPKRRRGPVTTGVIHFAVPDIISLPSLWGYFYPARWSSLTFPGTKMQPFCQNY